MAQVHHPDSTGDVSMAYDGPKKSRLIMHPLEKERYMRWQSIMYRVLIFEPSQVDNEEGHGQDRTRQYG
jgi:hypothetical protein